MPPEGVLVHAQGRIPARAQAGQAVRLVLGAVEEGGVARMLRRTGLSSSLVALLADPIPLLDVEEHQSAARQGQDLGVGIQQACRRAFRCVPQ